MSCRHQSGSAQHMHTWRDRPGDAQNTASRPPPASSPGPHRRRRDAVLAPGRGEGDAQGLLHHHHLHDGEGTGCSVQGDGGCGGVRGEKGGELRRFRRACSSQNARALHEPALPRERSINPLTSPAWQSCPVRSLIPCCSPATFAPTGGRPTFIALKMLAWYTQRPCGGENAHGDGMGMQAVSGKGQASGSPLGRCEDSGTPSTLGTMMERPLLRACTGPCRQSRPVGNAQPVQVRHPPTL